MGLSNFFNAFRKDKEENECMKILGMLDSVLDEEVSKEQQDAFHNHLEQCMPCYEKYNLDRSVKELLRSRCTHAPVPDNLVEEIRTQISKSNSF